MTNIETKMVFFRPPSFWYNVIISRYEDFERTRKGLYVIILFLFTLYKLIVRMNGVQNKLLKNLRDDIA